MIPEPMPTILDTFAGVNAIRDAIAAPAKPAPRDTERDDLVEDLLLEAEWHDDQAWVPVEYVATFILDNYERVPVLPEPTESAN